MNYKNNPLNIRSSAKYRWIGQQSFRNGFCTFHSVIYGVRAAIYLITRSYLRADKFMTVRDMLCRWAPATDGNDIVSYRQFVQNRCSFSVDETKVVDLNFDMLCQLLKAMCIIESGYILSTEIFTIAYKLLDYEKN